MRVHLLGNTCNCHFDLARLLREHGVDAHLFLTPGDQAHPQTRPESADPSLATSYPPWIHRLRPFAHRWRRLANTDRATRAALSSCDIVHTHANYATWLRGCRVPCVIQPFGGDFFVFPFGRPRNKVRHVIPDYRWIGFPGRIRAALRDASAIVLPNIDLLWRRAYQLLDDQPIAGIGLVIDTEALQPGTSPPPGPIAKLRRDHDLVFFQPTRQIWTDRGSRGHGGYSYGNDLFFRGLADAIRAGVSACLVVTDKQSDCTPASKALIRELGIADHVEWIPQMPRHELSAFYQHADVTVDAFYAGGFGSAALEAMACGTPVMMYFHEAGNRALFGEVAPVINVQTPAEIAESIERYASDKESLTKLGEAARDFVSRHHSAKAVGPKYIALYEFVVSRTATFPFVRAELFRDLIRSSPERSSN